MTNSSALHKEDLASERIKSGLPAYLKEKSELIISRVFGNSLLEKFDIEIEHITEYGNYVRTASGITFYFSCSMFCSDLYGRTYHRILNDDSAKDPSSEIGRAHV
mgnify:CR=1 FL=1